MTQNLHRPIPPGQVRSGPWLPVAVLILASPWWAGCIDEAPSPDATTPGILLDLVHARYEMEESRGAAGSAPLWSLRFDVGRVTDLSAPDEAGVPREWNGLRSTLVGTDAPDRPEFVLNDPESGCPRAVGYESSISSAEGGGARSRYVEYLLSDPALTGLQLDMDYNQGLNGGRLLLVYIGALARLASANPVPALAGVLPGVQAQVEGPEITLRFTEEHVFSHPNEWTIVYVYAADSRDLYPAEIRWSQEAASREVGRARMHRTAVQYGQTVLQATCSGTNDWTEPRVPTHLLGTDELPTTEPLPPEYPMSRAYADALALDGVKAFEQAHPDARLMAMNNVLQLNLGTPEGDLTVVQEMLWDLTFVSARDDQQVRVEVSRRFVSPGKVSDTPSGSVRPEEKAPEGVRNESMASTTPLLTFGQAWELARQAGLTNANRSGWGDPPWGLYPYPVWRVEYYHPDYGSSPEYNRTSFWYNAQSGWLLFSATNVPHE